MVDNCYGEFVETIEPTNVGADLMVGSLIKTRAADWLRPAVTLLERKVRGNAAYRLLSPGLGKRLAQHSV